MLIDQSNTTCMLPKLLQLRRIRRRRRIGVIYQEILFKKEKKA